MAKQKRSENTYQKINTIWKRDINNIIMPYDEFVDPCYEWLRNCKFDAEEKIDGTNTRIEVTGSLVENNEMYVAVEYSVDYKGKTDNAEMPKHLKKFITETYTEDKVLNALGLKKFIPFYVDSENDQFSDDAINHKWVDDNGKIDVSKISLKYTLYGEGYGVKIQSGGNYIKDGVGFIGFDVKVGDMYLLRENRDDIFNKLGCPIVPYIGSFTIDEAIDYVRKGFKSTIAENKDYDAEGLVLRSPYGLKNRRGERIIFKIKTCDFNKYRAKYGTDEKVEQIDNPHY